MKYLQGYSHDSYTAESTRLFYFNEGLQLWLSLDIYRTGGKKTLTFYKKMLHLGCIKKLIFLASEKNERK